MFNFNGYNESYADFTDDSDKVRLRNETAGGILSLQISYRTDMAVTSVCANVWGVHSESVVRKNWKGKSSFIWEMVRVIWLLCGE